MLFTRWHTDHLSLIRYPSVLSSLPHRLKGLYNGAFQIKMGFSHWYCTHSHTRLPGRWRNPVIELVQTGQAILCFIATCNLLCFHIHHISYIAQKTHAHSKAAGGIQFGLKGSMDDNGLSLRFSQKESMGSLWVKYYTNSAASSGPAG